MFNPALFIPGMLAMFNRNNKNQEKPKDKIEVGDYVMRRYDWNEYKSTDVERELSANRSYEVIALS